jgi:hypothetical protein
MAMARLVASWLWVFSRGGGRLGRFVGLLVVADLRVLARQRVVQVGRAGCSR